MTSITSTLTTWHVGHKLIAPRLDLSLDVTVSIFRDGHKSDIVAGFHRHRRILFEIEEWHRRAPNEPPSAGAFDRVDAGLLLRDAHGASWDNGSRSL